MGLSSKQQAILDQAKYGIEGSGMNFISDISKVDIINQPILVVGLGGTGIDAMLRVKAKVNETFRTGFNPNTGKRKTVPDNIRFIGVDTDKTYFVDPETGICEHKYKGFFVEEGEELNIGSNDLSSYFDHVKYDKTSYIMEWVNSGLKPGDASTGANGVRQIARLSIFKHFKSVHSKFTEVIKALTSADGAKNKKISVFVLSGISGGTGSGTFLDIPYIIQSATKSAKGMSETDNVWEELSIIGYLVTPDVSLLNNNVSQIKLNGYAALKELDYLMGIEERGETFKQQYSPFNTIYSSTKPYGLVNFVSSYFEDGTPVEDGYDSALQVIAENVIFFISNDATSDFGAWSYQNNVNTYINNMVSDLENANKLKPVGYKYGVLGASGKILPVQDIMTCLAAKLLDNINIMWEKHGEPTDEEVNRILSSNQFAFDIMSLTNSLNQGIADQYTEIKNNPMNFPNSTRDSIKRGGNATQDFEEMLRSHKMRIERNFLNEKFKEGLENNFIKKLEGFFTNTSPNLLLDPTNPNAPTTYGPRFANDVLVGVEGGTRLNCLKYCGIQKNKLTSEYNNIVDRLPNMISAAEIARQNVERSIVATNSKYNDYMQQMENIYTLKERQELCRILVDAYTYIENLIYDTNHKIFGTIYSTLTSLHAIFDKNMEVMGDVELRKAYEHSVLSWYVVNFTTVNDTIDEMLKSKDISVSAINLYKKIWENRASWSSDDVKNYQVIEEISDFLAKEFSDQLNLGLEEYINKEYEKLSNNINENPYKDFEDYISRKFNSDLTSTAAIMFNQRNDFKADTDGVVPGRLYIQVPEGCSKIYKALNSKHAPNVSASKNRSRIIYNNGLYGCPLYSYGQIEDYEKLYEDSIGKDPFVGVHLYQAGDIDWKDLPSVCPPITYTQHYNNSREESRVENAEKIFDKACEYGVIKMDPKKNCICAHFAGNIDIDKLRADAGNNLGALQKLYNELKGYMGEEKNLPEDKEIYKKDGFELIQLQHGSTKESAKFWFPSSYELIKRVKAENDKYDKIAESIKEIEADIASFDSYYIFAKALLTEVVVNKGPKYYYVPSDSSIEPIELAKKSELANSACAEFEIYDLLFNKGKLPESQQRFLLEDVNIKFAAFEDSADDITYETVYCPTIDNLVEKLLTIVKNVEFNESSIANAKEILDFYNILISFLKGIR